MTKTMIIFKLRLNSYSYKNVLQVVPETFGVLALKQGFKVILKKKILRGILKSKRNVHYKK